MKRLLAALCLCLMTVLPVHAGSLANDTFNRADTGGTQVEQLGTAPPVTWVSQYATKFFKIVSNTARSIDLANDAAERVSGIAFPANQYVEVVFGNISVSGLEVGYGPALRMDTSGTVATYYRLICSTSGWTLARFNAGVRTQIGTGATVFANGDRVRISIVGTSTAIFKMWQNGVEFGAGTTDATPLASGSAGIAYSSSAGSTISIDSFEAGATGGGMQPIFMN